MSLRAQVRMITGRVTHWQGNWLANEIAVTPIEHPTAVEIIEQDGGVYLLRFDQDGGCLADTWKRAGKRVRHASNRLEQMDRAKSTAATASAVGRGLTAAAFGMEAATCLDQ